MDRIIICPCPLPCMTWSWVSTWFIDGDFLGKGHLIPLKLLSHIYNIKARRNVWTELWYCWIILCLCPESVILVASFHAPCMTFVMPVLTKLVDSFHVAKFDISFALFDQRIRWGATCRAGDTHLIPPFIPLSCLLVLLFPYLVCGLGKLPLLYFAS